MAKFSKSQATAIPRVCDLLPLLLMVLTPALGCSEDNPFDVAPVDGTVTYSDGSQIDADQLVVQFVPEKFEAKGKVASRSASTYVDTSTGSFSELTTWKHADGAIVGRHKVVVIALASTGSNAGSPTNAVPSRYHRAETTPLEVEVKPGGANHFSLKVEKGP